MRHLGTLPLQAGEYHLRRITMKDVPAAYQNWLSDPEYCRFLRSAPHRSPAETEGFLAEQVARYCDRTRYFWAIADRNDQPVGCIGVSVPLRGTTGSVVFIVGRPWWGQGIASSCLREVLRRVLKKPLGWVARKLGVNDTAIAGMLAASVSATLAFTQADDMDARGLVVMCAFAATAAHVIGGQLGVVASLAPDLVVPFVLSKLIAGAAGIAVALLLTRREERAA